MKIILSISIIFSLTLTSCGSKSVTPEIQKEEKSVTSKRIPKEAFKNYLMENKDYQLVDVRTPDEYTKGFIQDAKNIDFWGENFELEIKNLDKSKPTLIYCHSGGRSAKALKKMQTLGFQFVLELEGGYSNWKD